MSFEFYLYRGPPGLASLLDWEEDHAESLGRAEEVRHRISSVFPSLVWEELADGSLAANGSGDSDEPRELSLRATELGQVQFVIVYAAPQVLRVLMTELQLNYCCAPESGELRDPFSVGADWRDPT